VSYLLAMRMLSLPMVKLLDMLVVELVQMHLYIFYHYSIVILHIIVLSYFVFLCQQKVLCFCIFCQSNQTYDKVQIDKVVFMTIMTTI